MATVHDTRKYFSSEKD